MCVSKPSFLLQPRSCAKDSHINNGPFPSSPGGNLLAEPSPAPRATVSCSWIIKQGAARHLSCLMPKQTGGFCLECLPRQTPLHTQSQTLIPAPTLPCFVHCPIIITWLASVHSDLVWAGWGLDRVSPGSTPLPIKHI